MALLQRYMAVFMLVGIVSSSSTILAQRIQFRQVGEAPALSRPVANGNSVNRTTHEAENIANSVTNGRVITQDMRQFGQWSNGQQILWIDNRPGHRLELTFRSEVAGRAQVVVGMTQAADFGNVDIGFDGQKLASVSGYSATVKRTTVSLGELNLKRGNNTLIFALTGKERLSTGYRVGIDGIEVQTRMPDRPVGGNRFPGPIVDRIPPRIPNESPLPHRPDLDDVARIPNDGNRAPLPEQIKLPEGANLYVEQGEFDLRTPQHLKQGSYTVLFTYDVSKVQNANAVVMQIVSGSFSNQVDQGGYPNMSPGSLLSSIVLPGNFGRYKFDTRQLAKSTASSGPSYSVRIIPVSDQTKKSPVGQSSNTMEVYKDRAPPTSQTNLTKMLQAQRFADLVEERISQKVSGYALAVIPFQGQPETRQGGVARTETDGAARAMTVHDRLNVASVTKFAVAIAMVKAIDANPAVDLDTSISDYLPADWRQGPGVDTITFRELLQHQSGLRSWEGLGTDDDSLKELIQCGITDLNLKNEYEYENQNYGLIRFLLPKVKFIQGPNGNGPKTLLNVNVSVLSPAGIDWASGEPDPGTALSHTFPAAKNKGRNWDAKVERFGSSGLHISAMEMATLMHAFARTEKVIRADLRNEMIQDQLGGRLLTDAGGSCFGKGGYLRSRKPAKSVPSNRIEQNTMVLVFSDGSVAALAVNSSYADSPKKAPDFSVLLIECFNECYSAF